MSFDSVLGQPTAVATLQAALRSGRVHHAYRFEGPQGVGKQLCAVQLARALIDPEGRASAEAFRVGDGPDALPTHPDLIVIGRGLYREQLSSSEATGISVEQVRKMILPRAGFPPHQGQALVFIIRDAEELSVSAANALLKTLEEPRPGVHFILLSSAPERLLDTVRSRTLKVRFGPLPQAVIETLLRRAGKPVELAAVAEGSARLAFLLAEEELLQAREAFLNSARAALTAPDFAAALDLASNLPKERDALREQLHALSSQLAQAARGNLPREPARSLRAATQFGLVQSALLAIERNVNPTLVVESLFSQLRRA